MYFKRLELHGFKSFAEPCTIDFHEGITCIVGPNGSGKSNISDAIRWVLGEQSPKALRGGKMEEVIFSGTASRNPRGMAEVTLVIDNEESILDIEYKEVAITRRMYRSGESEYLINGNNCRLKDIRNLIMDTGIGVDGYSIIGQGKIAEIVSSRPETRREIFEEAAGIVAYKTKKQETTRKLEGTRNNLNRIEDIIAEIENRIGSLKKESENAKRYLELKDRYKDLEINITLRNINSIIKTSDQYKTDIIALGNEIDNLLAKKDEEDKISSNLYSQNMNLDSRLKKANEKRIYLVEKINNITGESKLSREKLNSLVKDENRIDNEIDNITIKIDELKKEKDIIESEMKDIEAEKEKSKERLESQNLLFQSILLESKEIANQINDNKDKIIELNNKMASGISEVRSYENYKQTLENRQLKIEEENRELESRQKETDETVDDFQKNLKKMETEKSHILKEIFDLQDAIKASEEKEQTLKFEVEDLRVTNSKNEARLRTFEEMEQNYEGYNSAVKYIMRAGIKGIEGVVGDMMEVPKGLETAVETALGAGMQNIIVKDDISARNAITALKINKSGRLTFLPIGSVKSGNIKVDTSLKNHPGYRGMAVDLISFESKYRNIFEYLLGRVAIIDNLNSAIQLSKTSGRGIRFVTLDGEVINTSGAITGGKYKNQSANLLARKNEILNLKNIISKSQESLKEKTKLLNILSDENRELNAKILNNREKSREIELDIARVNEKISADNKTSLDIKTRIEKNILEINEINKELSNMDKIIEKIMRDSESFQIEIDKIDEKVNILTANTQSRNDNEAKANSNVTEAKVKVEALTEKLLAKENILNRIKDELGSLKKQNDIKEKELLDIRNQRSELTAGYKGSDSEVINLEKDREKLEIDIQNLNSDKVKISEALNDANENLKIFEESLSKFRDEKYRLEIRETRNETQVENMKEKLWNEFEVSYAQAKSLWKDNFVMTPAIKESREIKKEIREIGDVNIGAIKEFQETSQRYTFLTEQRQDVVIAMEELQSIIDDLEKTITRSFKDNFNKVEQNFENVFKELFGGGHAELRLEDEKEPLTSGIEIVAQPPGKRLQNLNLMSGGEKTMTAIALMFAVLKTKPTPFCILDEVEAALDDENIEKFSAYLKNFKETQFALITHQKATMEHGDSLYGVTMPERGISKMLSLRMGDYDENEYIS